MHRDNKIVTQNLQQNLVDLAGLGFRPDGVTELAGRMAAAVLLGYIKVEQALPSWFWGWRRYGSVPTSLDHIVADVGEDAKLNGVLSQPPLRACSRVSSRLGSLDATRGGACIRTYGIRPGLSLLSPNICSSQALKQCQVVRQRGCQTSGHR